MFWEDITQTASTHNYWLTVLWFYTNLSFRLSVQNAQYQTCIGNVSRIECAPHAHVMCVTCTCNVCHMCIQCVSHAHTCTMYVTCSYNVCHMCAICTCNVCHMFIKMSHAHAMCVTCASNVWHIHIHVQCMSHVHQNVCHICIQSVSHGHSFMYVTCPCTTNLWYMYITRATVFKWLWSTWSKSRKLKQIDLKNRTK